MNQNRKITLSALFLALALVLPFLTGQIPEFGKMLTPMHFPIILGSLIVGPLYGLIIGLVAPVLRMLLFGMPPMPMSIMMALELAAYGLLTGLLYRKLKSLVTNDIVNVFVSLVVSMVIGRVVFALAMLVFTGATNFFAVFAVTFTGSLPGIILQLILIPLIFIRVKKAK